MPTLAELESQYEALHSAYYTALTDGAGVAKYRTADGRMVERSFADCRAALDALKAEIASKRGGARTRARFRRAS